MLWLTRLLLRCSCYHVPHASCTWAQLDSVEALCEFGIWHGLDKVGRDMHAVFGIVCRCGWGSFYELCWSSLCSPNMCATRKRHKRETPVIYHPTEKNYHTAWVGSRCYWRAAGGGGGDIVSYSWICQTQSRRVSLLNLFKK